MAKRPKPKKVCVVGGAGYIGMRLVPELIEKGYKVTVVDPCWFGNKHDESVTLVKSDVLKVPEDFFKGFDTALFLGGLSSDPMAQYSSAFNFVSNLAAPAYAAFAARHAGVRRFIFADSCSVYGNAGGHICDESAPLTSDYPYGASKAQANRAIMHLVEKGTFSVIALRQGTVSGWSPRMRFDLLVNAMYKNAWLNKKIVVDNPRIGRPLFAIEDTVQAFILAIEAPEALSGTYNVASLNVTVGQVGKEVQKHFKRAHSIDIAIEEQAKPDLRDYAANIDKAKKELGFVPRGSIASILEGLDSHFGATCDYTDDIYYNIRVFMKIFEKVSRI